MAGDLHLENFAEKVVRIALVTEGNNALNRAENYWAQNRDEEALAYQVAGELLLNVAGTIANSFRTGLLPGTEGTRELAPGSAPAPR
jgi:hypothetical protein